MPVDELAPDEIPCGRCGEVIEIADVYCPECGAENEGFDMAAFGAFYGMNPTDAISHYCQGGDYHEDFNEDMFVHGGGVVFCNLCGEALGDEEYEEGEER